MKYANNWTVEPTLKITKNECLQLCSKETLAQVFFSDFCETFKDTYFVEHLQKAVSITWKFRKFTWKHLCRSLFFNKARDLTNTFFIEYLCWLLLFNACITEAATGYVLWEKVFLEISQNSQENTCTRVSFLINLQASGFHKWNSYFRYSRFPSALKF